MNITMNYEYNYEFLNCWRWVVFSILMFFNNPDPITSLCRLTGTHLRTFLNNCIMNLNNYIVKVRQRGGCCPSLLMIVLVAPLDLSIFTGGFSFTILLLVLLLSSFFFLLTLALLLPPFFLTYKIYIHTYIYLFL